MWLTGSMSPALSWITTDAGSAPSHRDMLVQQVSVLQMCLEQGQPLDLQCCPLPPYRFPRYRGQKAPLTAVFRQDDKAFVCHAVEIRHSITSL